MYKSLQMSVDGAVATLSFTGPGRGNAMGPDTWAELPRAVAELEARGDVRALVVRGAGKTFCYGLDLPATAGAMGPLMQSGADAAQRRELLRHIHQMQEAVTSLTRFPFPVIAAMHGWCIGAGLDVAAACDIRLCSAETRFSLREVRVAIVADLGALQRLPRIIGHGNLRELAFTGKDIDAQRALRMGLVNEVFADEQALFAAAHAMAADIAAQPPLTVQGIKHVLEDQVAREDARGLSHVATYNAAFLPAEDLMEAMAAFVERRPPSFKGR
jgi:enoyl-CoA hydratase